MNRVVALVSRNKNGVTCGGFHSRLRRFTRHTLEFFRRVRHEAGVAFPLSTRLLGQVESLTARLKSNQRIYTGFEITFITTETTTWTFYRPQTKLREGNHVFTGVYWFMGGGGDSTVSKTAEASLFLLSSLLNVNIISMHLSGINVAYVFPFSQLKMNPWNFCDGYTWEITFLWKLNTNTFNNWRKPC